MCQCACLLCGPCSEQPALTLCAPGPSGFRTPPPAFLPVPGPSPFLSSLCCASCVHLDLFLHLAFVTEHIQGTIRLHDQFWGHSCKTQSVPWRQSLSKRWQTTNCRLTMWCHTGLDKREPSVPTIPNRSPRDSAGISVGEEGQDPSANLLCPIMIDREQELFYFPSQSAASKAIGEVTSEVINGTA